MHFSELRWYHILSIVASVWACLARAFPRALASPFPLCFAALAFAVPYHAFVLRDPISHVVASAWWHALVATISPFDVSWATMSASFLAFFLHAAIFDFFQVYGCAIPLLHKNMPDKRRRMKFLFRTLDA